MRFLEFNKDDYLIHNREHLDKYLVGLCSKIVEGQQKDPEQYGMVAACVLDPDHNMVASTSTKEGDKWSHAERNAMAAYESKYGEIPEGSIILTTLSPCDGPMADRYEGSCTDLINDSPVKKVYSGYMDPSQHNEGFEFTVEATTNEDIRALCKKFADTFLGDENHPLNELDVSKTLNFIKKAHSTQQYGNKPYWNHPKSVAATGKKFFGAAFGPDAIKAAFLHDVVEDTPYTLQQLGKMGFTPEVVQAVQLLTKNKSLSYEDNIKNIIASGNKIAMMVKYADNYQNYTGDKSSWDPKRAASSQKKYLASLNMLGSKLGVQHHIPTNEGK